MRKGIVTLLLLGQFLPALVLAEGTATVADDDFIGAVLDQKRAPALGSAVAMIYDEESGQPLYAKNADSVVPIASITKLVTAMVILDARLPLDEPISIEPEDRDRFKGSRSRMKSGMTLTRGDLLKLALMASENKAAAALARTFPGGTQVALAMMNAKARELGMDATRFTDPTGLRSENVSTARDLVKLVVAAQGYELIREYSTSSSHVVKVGERRSMRFGNTNPLVRSAAWDIGLSKTGYISEAGRCLVMQATILQRPMVIVLLDSWGKRTRIGDANRLRQWMEKAVSRSLPRRGGLPRS